MRELCTLKKSRKVVTTTNAESTTGPVEAIEESKTMSEIWTSELMGIADTIYLHTVRETLLRGPFEDLPDKYEEYYTELASELRDNLDELTGDEKEVRTKLPDRLLRLAKDEVMHPLPTGSYIRDLDELWTPYDDVCLEVSLRP
jgi:hypothetical protein